MGPSQQLATMLMYHTVVLDSKAIAFEDSCIVAYSANSDFFLCNRSLRQQPTSKHKLATVSGFIRPVQPGVNRLTKLRSAKNDTHLRN